MMFRSISSISPIHEMENITHRVVYYSNRLWNCTITANALSAMAVSSLCIENPVLVYVKCKVNSRVDDVLKWMTFCTLIDSENYASHEVKVHFNTIHTKQNPFHKQYKNPITPNRTNAHTFWVKRKSDKEIQSGINFFLNIRFSCLCSHRTNMTFFYAYQDLWINGIDRMSNKHRQNNSTTKNAAW